MPERLTPVDSHLVAAQAFTPGAHLGTLMVFTTPAGGFGADRLRRLVEDRLDRVPRYRQRVRQVPGRLGDPVWVDDDRLDLRRHVRRSVLPRPGTAQQLGELVARIQPRPLDPRHPLWEVYLVDGLEGGRFAILTKSHRVLVDGPAHPDLAQVLVDDPPGTSPTPVLPTPWRPARAPSGAELVTGAVLDTLRRPDRVGARLRPGLDAIRTGGERVVGAVAGLLPGAPAPATSMPATSGPEATALAGPGAAQTGRQRRYATLAADLDAAMALCAHHDRAAESPGAPGAPRVTVGDVVLATVAAGVRTWLVHRHVPLVPGTVVRTLVLPGPSLGADEAAGRYPAPAAGVRVIELPVGEPDPVVRLYRVADRADRTSGTVTVSTGQGFAPATRHAQGLRLADQRAPGRFPLVVSLVPGPPVARTVDGVQLLAGYPVLPLGLRQLLAVGVTSYVGGLCYGLTADRDAVPDLEVLRQGIGDAFTELAPVA